MGFARKMKEKRSKKTFGSIENDWNNEMIYKEQVVKISWFTAILTSSSISLTTVTTVHLLRSKNSQRSIICDLLKVSRKGFEVLFLFASSSNLLSGHSEGQK